MQFWIKKYPHGEVGRWIHSKKVGDDIEIRGPLTTWPWKDDAWDEVVMVSTENHLFCEGSKPVIDFRGDRYHTLRAILQYKNHQPLSNLEDSLHSIALLSNARGTTSSGAFEPLDHIRQ
jgi:hypothetical protein